MSLLNRPWLVLKESEERLMIYFEENEVVHYDLKVSNESGNANDDSLFFSSRFLFTFCFD